MRIGVFIVAALAVTDTSSWAELKSGPPLPTRLSRTGRKLPAGWNFGDARSGCRQRRQRWVYNRGKHPVIEFDKNGNFLQGWGEDIMTSAHGIKVDADGAIWTVDVKGHIVFKLTRGAGWKWPLPQRISAR